MACAGAGRGHVPGFQPHLPSTGSAVSLEWQTTRWQWRTALEDSLSLGAAHSRSPLSGSSFQTAQAASTLPRMHVSAAAAGPSEAETALTTGGGLRRTSYDFSLYVNKI